MGHKRYTLKNYCRQNERGSNMKTLSISLMLFFSVVTFQSCGDNPSGSDNIGNNWIYLGLAGKQIVRFRSSKSYVYACAGGDGLFRVPNSSLAPSWEYIGLSDTTLLAGIDTTKGGNIPVAAISDIVVNPDNENELLAAVGSSRPNVPGIYKTTDGGGTWVEADSGYGFLVDCQDSGTIKAARVLFSPPRRPNIVFAATISDGYLFESSTFGRVWGMRPVIDAGMFSVTCIAADPANPDVIYAGTNVGQHHCYYRFAILPPPLCFTTDGGVSWNFVQPPVSFSPSLHYYSGISSIHVSGNSHEVYIGTGNEILGSRDGGSTWKRLLTADDSTSSFSSIAVDPSNENNMLAANGTALFKSDNAGGLWTKLSLPQIFGGEISSLLWDKYSGNLYAAAGSDFSGVANVNHGVYVLPNASAVLFGKRQ